MSGPNKTSKGSATSAARRRKRVRAASAQRSVPVMRGPLVPRGLLIENEPMARHTSWKVGGNARRYFEPADRDDLIDFIKHLPADEPLLWIGLGSNLLVRDGGWKGTVICLHQALVGLVEAGATELYAEAGVHCARLAKFAQQKKRAGLGFMAGIPGTLGGALAMNAGAWGSETWPAVRAVEVIYRDGKTAWLEASEFSFDYRHVDRPAGVSGFLGARLEVGDDQDGLHEKETREWLARRKATQPVGKPTAGSTFRNPKGDHAARLIESCGLKGTSVGLARVSELHANFILTQSGACAADVESLIEKIQQVVREQQGVELVREVLIVGDPGELIE